MDADHSHLTERILHLTLEIICLLTGETFTAVTSGDLVAIMAPQHHFVIPKRTNKEIILEVTKKIIELLTGEVPIRYQDVAVYLTTEEREYLEGHEEHYKAAMMEGQLPVTPLDDISPGIPAEMPHPPFYSQDCTVESQTGDPGDGNTSGKDKIKEDVGKDSYRMPPIEIEEDAHCYQATPGFAMMGQYEEERSTEVIDLDSPEEDHVTPDIHQNMADGSPSHRKDFSVTKSHTTTQSSGNGGEEQIPCPQCSKTFTSKYALLSHLRVHSGERPFLCCECGKRFTQRRNLIRHEQIHSGGRGFPCALCGRTFTRKLYLDKHLKNHTVQGNDVTPTSDAPLTPDDDGEHGDIRQVSTGTMPVTSVIYPGLAESLTDLSNLVQSFPSRSLAATPDIQPALHTEERSNDRPDYEKPPPEMAEEISEETFSCSECGECFKSKSALHAHWKIHMEERPFPCFECGKCFARKDNLIQHQIIHSGEKPFSCNLCKKSFARKSNLAEHRKTHIVPEQNIKQAPADDSTSSSERIAEVEITLDYPEEEPAVPSEETSADPISNPELAFADNAQDQDEDRFKCAQCGKRFTSKYALLSHQRVHTEERPFSCFECGKRFTRKDNLKQHLTLHFREKPLLRPAPEKHSPRKHQKVHEHSVKDTSEEHDSSSPDHDAEVEITLDFPEEKPTTPDIQSQHDNADRPTDLPDPEDSSPENTQTDTNKAKMKGVFSCSECGKFFSSKYAVLSHRRIHSGERPYSCVECGRRFTRKDNLVRHRVIHSKGYKPGKHFSKKAAPVDVTSHTGNQDGKKSLKGDHVLPPDVAEVIIDYPEENSIFENANASPNIAETSADPSNPKEPSGDTSHADGKGAGERRTDEVSCSVCGKCFASRYALHSHGRIHTEGSYPCSECGKRFTRKYNLKQHLILHAKKKLLQRATSRRSFSEKSDLGRYQTPHPASADGHIEKRTSGEHITSDSEEVVEITLDFPEEIPVSQIYADQHGAQQLAEEPFSDKLNVNIQSAGNPKDGDFCCSRCGICFISINALHSHQSVHTEERPAPRSGSHAAQEACEILSRYPMERTNLTEDITDTRCDGNMEAYARADQFSMEEAKIMVKTEEEDHPTDISLWTPC